MLMHHLVLAGLQDSGKGNQFTVFICLLVTLIFDVLIACHTSWGTAGMEGAGVDWAMILDGHAASSLMIERGGGGMIVRGTLFILCPA